jgi:hypothetical protein
MTDRYDPLTFVHWLYWRLKVLEVDSMGFQRLFETVMKRAGDQFVSVKPHGKLGDRKCDGLHYGDGVVFQVYSPDRVERTKTLKKIREDLAGAVAEWGDALREWVFVYNTRAGVAADVPHLLKQEAKKYPHLLIRPLSDDDLWKDVVRPLGPQDRVEILGAPPGFEAMFPAPDLLPEDVQERLRSGCFVVIQDTMSPVNLQNALEAVHPARPLGPPLYLRRRPEDLAWHLAAEHQQRLVEEALELSREHLPRFATFGFTPIALAIHLGFLLSDRVEVTPYQWHRERYTWAWDPTVTLADTEFVVTGIPKTAIAGAVDVVLRVSLSARVTSEQTAAVVPNASIEIDFAVGAPDTVAWLRHPEQIGAFRREFRETLARIHELVPGCARIHLFAAVPMACAVAAGQAINPRMNAPIQLYEYDRREEPPYRAVLLLD